MAFIRATIHFLLTVKFGVVLMLALMGVMMFATQFEATYGTRAMKSLIYGSIWFDLGVALFVVNIVTNTLRRRPFKFRHTGFLTVHTGVLIIVFGGLMTRWFGVDGTMPIPEGEASREISLPDSDIRIAVGDELAVYRTEYELRPSEADHDDLFEVPDTPYLLQVSKYFPSGAVMDTLMNDSVAENPMIRVAVGGTGEPAGDWLSALDPVRNTIAGGGARVTFVVPAGLDALRKRWERPEEDAAEESRSAGHLQLVWSDGRAESIHVPMHSAEPIPTSREGVSVEVSQVFRSFTLTEEGHADAVGSPANPAIRFQIHGPHGHEDHFSFTAFPEFRRTPPDGEEWILSHAVWEPDPHAFHDHENLEVAIVQEAPERFVTYTSWGDPTDGMPVTVGETRSFPSRTVMLRILDAADHGRLSRTVRKVSDEVIRPVIKVELMERAGDDVRVASPVNWLRGRPAVRPADVTPNEAWVFHGENYVFDTPAGPVDIAYKGDTIPLEFGIHLDDFREERYPGISLAASFESHVRVQPDGGEEFPERIYMNHPLIYQGYTFYQASFQRTPSGEEITVLSVARDPGMTISFFGYVVLVLGLILIFWVKPYFRKLDDRIARSREARQGVTT
ncbi:MAG: hypothetical protein HKN12_06885 [Gemmatimonadetes bacterium]|nr:hypothetical protein [Gemmatimonadota bacterium]